MLFCSYCFFLSLILSVSWSNVLRLVVRSEIRLNIEYLYKHVNPELKKTRNQNVLIL